MHVAIALYPRLTALDAIGPYQVFAYQPGWRVSLVAAGPAPVTDDKGTLSIVPTADYHEVDRPDIVLVPGGAGTVQAMGDERLLDWLRRVHRRTSWTGSVCSGAFVLAAAGILAGRRATTHWGWRRLLADLGVDVIDERVVFDGKVVTGAGVSAGIDLALEVLERATDEPAARTVQLALEYDPRPPHPGDPAAAPVELRAPAIALGGVKL